MRCLKEIQISSFCVARNEDLAHAFLLDNIPHTQCLFWFQWKNTIDKFLSSLPTLFNRGGNNSICCTWLEPRMRKLWLMSLPGIWTLKAHAPAMAQLS